jgi:hypothetical protein
LRCPAYTHVGGDLVAGLQQDQVADDDLGGVNLHPLSVTNDHRSPWQQL